MNTIMNNKSQRLCGLIKTVLTGLSALTIMFTTMLVSAQKSNVEEIILV